MRLGKLLFPLFALALDLPESFFDDKVLPRQIAYLLSLTSQQTTKPAAIMRLLYYPPQTGTVDDRIEGIGAHTEWATLKRHRYAC